MRKILIIVETDSENSVEELKKDLQREINCCSACFYTDEMLVKEIENSKEPIRIENMI